MHNRIIFTKNNKNSLLEQQDLFCGLSKALGVQGYDLLFDSVKDGVLFVSVYDRKTGDPVSLETPVRDLLESDDLFFLSPDSFDSEPDPTPAADMILFEEDQQNGQKVVIWYDFSDTDFPVVLSAGLREYRFISWTAAINCYRNKFGLRDQCDEAWAEKMGVARGYYRILRHRSRVE